jgi:hypothetical protein
MIYFQTFSITKDGFLLIHQYLNQPTTQDLFTKALHCGWVTTLFRDEVLHTHSFVQQYFESHKGYNKRVSEVKDAYNWVLQNRYSFNHKTQNKFL